MLETFPFGQIDLSNMTEWLDHVGRMTKAIPETNTENTTKTNKNNKKGAILSEVAPCVFLFFSLYGEWFKVEHPHIKIEQIERAEDSISSFLEEICLEGDLEALEDMIMKYFHATFSSGTDYSINHFANHEIMLHRAQECGYVTME